MPSLIYQIFIAIAFFHLAFSDVIVDTPNGKVRGLTTKTRRGREIFTFYSIRYAEPPTGENRFKPPIPAKPWQNIQNATTPGIACMQPDPPSSITVSEDCLFLDVYSTNLNGSQPVIVFIHGGRFVRGSKLEVSPDYLLDKDVVLVSINYRQDVFGFFNIGTKDSSGNQGLKDQNLALKWLQTNIKSFGGNPGLITLCGDGTGGSAINFHLVSPMSQGLFHRAIFMSGTGVGYQDSETNKWSKFFLEESSCNNTDSAEAVKCLQRLSADDLVAIGKKIYSIVPWFYVIESPDDDQPFLTESPISVARRGGMQKMPLMGGLTVDDFLVLAKILFAKWPHVIEKLNKDFIKEAPDVLFYESYSQKNEVSEKIRSFYLKNQSITNDNMVSFGDLLTDSILGNGLHRLMEYGRRDSNVYYYQFDFQGRYSHDYRDKEHHIPLGVIHRDDLQYVFVTKGTAPVLPTDDPENFMIERMTSWWSEFARTGDPNDPSNEYIKDVTWLPCNNQGVHSILINDTLKVISGEYDAERFQLWDSLFPLY